MRNSDDRIVERGWITRTCLITAFAIMLAGPFPALGQDDVGELYGAVRDQADALVPGVTLTLYGMGAPQTQVSNEQGLFRFLRLDPGTYHLMAVVDGFANSFLSDISIRSGHAVTLDVGMTLEVTDVIHVAAGSVLLDERRIRKGAVISQQQLETIPTVRDPWGLLRQVPGVVQDTTNVGGEASGWEAVFVGPGSAPYENNYAMDGVQVTDMGAVRSPGYYDFNSFEEVAYTTGGSDPTLVTPGVTVNMITKRGTNEWKGAARLLVTDSQWQSSSSIDRSDFASGQEEIEVGQIREIYEYGFDVGGPVVADRFWLWGAWGRNDINRNAAGGLPNDTLLTNFSIKANAQLSAANSLVAWYSRGDKEAIGFNASPYRERDATMTDDLVAEVWKIEDSHVVSPELFVTGFVSGVENDWWIIPQGGMGPEAPEPLLDAEGVLRRNTLQFRQDTPSRQIQASGSYFLTSGKTSHTFTLGARLREFGGYAEVGWPGERSLVNNSGTAFGLPPGLNVFFLHRGLVDGETDYESLWFQDTVTRSRWTLNLGLRWDRQSSHWNPVSVPANAVRPDLFPAVEQPGGELPFTWSDLQPRLGVTYALGASRETLLRFSLSRFVEQLSGLDSLHTSLLGVEHPNFIIGQAAYFLFVDLNGDSIYTDGEPNFFIGADNIDPLNPTETPNEVDSGLEAQLTDELILGFERQLAPDLVGLLDVTWRRVHRIQELRRTVHDFADGDGEVRVATRDDYTFTRPVTGTLPDGKSYNVPLYSLAEGLVPTGGSYMTNGDREQEFLGVTLGFNKRLANRWSARGFVHWSDWEWRLGPAFRRYDDPTDLLGSQDNESNTVAHSAGIAGKDGTYLQSTWKFNLNGLYEVAPEQPWGFNISGSLTGREGFPLPYYSLEIGTDGVQRAVQVTEEVDSYRNDDLYALDLRIEKKFPLGSSNLTVGVDGFNLLNSAAVTQRDLMLNGPTPAYLLNTVSPRIFRVGVRLSYR